ISQSATAVQTISSSINQFTLNGNQLAVNGRAVIVGNAGGRIVANGNVNIMTTALDDASKMTVSGGNIQGGIIGLNRGLIVVTNNSKEPINLILAARSAASQIGIHITDGNIGGLVV